MASRARRLVALLLVAALAAACVSVHPTGSRKIGGTTGGISVRVYADDAGRRAARLAPSRIMAEVDRRRSDRSWEPIFRSLAASWTVAGLPPGEYRVRFPAMLDETGNVVRLRESSQSVRVRAGEIVQVETTLSHVSGVLVAAGVVTAVVAAVLLHDWLDDHDLPLPPLPPPDVVEAFTYVTLDLAFDGGGEWRVQDRAPAVTSHFPAEGDLVAARRLRVVFALSEPLGERTVAPDAVVVLGEESGFVAGHSTYDPEHWWVVWNPDGELPRGQTLHVTLAADAVESVAGRELPFASSFSFRTTE